MLTGWVAPGWEPVRAAFVRGCADDPGAAQLAVHHHGRPVVDLAAGPPGFGTDSVGVLMSVTKGLVAVCAHLLSERGDLDLDAPVARYWPEFAAAGKAGTTVSDLLTHRAGLPAFAAGPAGCGLPGLLDRDARVDALAAMRPVWEPGTACLYHALTYGHLVGEVVRRVCGRSVGAFFAAEVAEPLGLDLWIGLPAREEHRFAPQYAVHPDPTPEQVAGFLAGLGLAPDAPLSLALRASQAELAAAVEGLTTREGRAPSCPAPAGSATPARCPGCTRRSSGPWTGCGCCPRPRWNGRSSRTTTCRPRLRSTAATRRAAPASGSASSCPGRGCRCWAPVRSGTRGRAGGWGWRTRAAVSPWGTCAR
ncbi:serine hydrolase domain-containing protein [Streptomyces sp. NPDC016469]|uniref:serine hydrolase domain-containing protein n=1 Tax=Streptomyces sp. NPDC016469 TaxID=3157191 RepID=UPI0033F0F1C2